MSNIVAVLIVRCTHTGVYADGRPNPASVTIYDLDEITIQKNRTRYVPVPPNTFVDIPMSTRTFVSYHDGDICKLVARGLLTAEVILQLRDKENDGGPTGTGQALRPAVLNIERVANSLRMVIPNNVIPTDLSSVGYIVGEPILITGLTGDFRKLNGEYVIDSAAPGFGLAGADAGSYLITAPSEGADIAATTLAGVNIRLNAPCGGGRVVAQFNSGGDVGGLGDNVFGYIGGQLFPNAGGGAGAIAIYDEGILIDAAATTIDFIGAGVTASSAGPGLVDVTIPGGGGGAPVDAEYVVLALNATLTNERVLTAGTGISIVDGGAGSTVTLSVDATLAEILGNGNSTGGNDILITTGDSIVGQTDLVLNPGPGVGDNVIIDGLTWPSADGAPGQALITNGAGVLSFGNPAPAAHAPTHIHLGSDEIDGDRLDIDYTPTHYTPDTTPPEVTSTQELTAHLAGIDDALGDLEAKTFTAGEALSVGDVLTLNASGDVVRANSSISAGLWEVIGVSTQAVLGGATVRVVTKSGTCPPVRFGAAPAGAFNGTLVFLDSTSGQATTTPPTAGGNTLFTVGTLQGADGISTTPTVVFRPQYLVQRR
jgi:hypothetical protein